LKQQAMAGDICLLFGDESEALTHPDLAHTWAERGADLRVEAPGQAKKRALRGALDHAAGERIVTTSATKRSGDFVDLLARLDRAYGPRPGREGRPVVLVLDSAAAKRGRPNPHQQGYQESARRAALAHGRMAA
jgi:DDE superfamily endonuclease